MEEENSAPAKRPTSKVRSEDSPNDPGGACSHQENVPDSDHPDRVSIKAHSDKAIEGEDVSPVENEADKSSECYVSEWASKSNSVTSKARTFKDRAAAELESLVWPPRTKTQQLSSRKRPLSTAGPRVLAKRSNQTGSTNGW